MLTDPYNHLQPSLHDLALNAIHAEAERNRSALQGCPQIDGQFIVKLLHLCLQICAELFLVLQRSRLPTKATYISWTDIRLINAHFVRSVCPQYRTLSLVVTTPG